MVKPCHTVETDPEVYVLFTGIDVPSLYLLTFKFCFVQHWVPIETVLYTLPSTSVTVEVPQVKDGVTTHGTPGQFSRAAFFQRTFISSKLYKAFLFSSTGPLSFDWVFFGIATFELDWAKLKSGSKDINKILSVIL